MRYEVLLEKTETWNAPKAVEVEASYWYIEESGVLKFMKEGKFGINSPVCAFGRSSWISVEEKKS